MSLEVKVMTQTTTITHNGEVEYTKHPQFHICCVLKIPILFFNYSVKSSWYE